MKLLVDAQLSPAIARWINENFTDLEAVSVWQSGLREASDRQIFEFARLNGFVIMSKDADFIRLKEQMGSPPQIIWITCGNTSNESMKRILSTTLEKCLSLLKAGEDLVEISDSLPV